MDAGLTFLRVVGNEDLARQEEEARDAALDERQNEPLILGLVGHLKECWDAARLA